MEEIGSTRTSSNNNPVYRDPRSVQAGIQEVSQDYNQQSRTAYQQRGYSPGMDRQRNYEKEHQPLPSSREEERKSSWESYSEKNARKEYSRSRDYNEYREFCNFLNTPCFQYLLEFCVRAFVKKFLCKEFFNLLDIFLQNSKESYRIFR